MSDLSHIGEREKLKPKAGNEPHWQRLRQGASRTADRIDPRLG
ncbi:MAG: hypothetical protein AAFY25_02870 [Pseudomonadota bacterium]